MIGSGAMGTVYRAIDADGNRYAIKVLQAHNSNDPETVERFQREARALFGLKHPNLIEVKDFGVEANAPYLVMEHAEGRSLEEFDEPFSPSAAFAVARQILSGLAYAHGQGIVHRDLKLANVVAHEDGAGWHVKLLDFGLVKFTDNQKWGQGGNLTVAGAVFGSPAYMSPEQASGKPLDARSDVYSVGVMVFELFAGRWPFEAPSEVDIMMMHLRAPVPSLELMRPELEVRPEMNALIQRAMAKQKEQRFSDAREMLQALDALPKPPVRMRSQESTEMATVAVASASLEMLAHLGSAQTTAAQTEAQPAQATPFKLETWHIVVAAAVVGVVVLGVVVLAILFL